jgi:putative flippase GtrA
LFIRFLIVGGFGFLIDVSITYFLISTGISNWFARVPAISLAMISTWIINRYFTYKVKSDNSSQEAFRYLSIATLMAFLNYVIYLFLTLKDFIPLSALMIATTIQIILSFYLYRQFVFKEP